MFLLQVGSPFSGSPSSNAPFHGLIGLQDFIRHAMEASPGFRMPSMTVPSTHSRTRRRLSNPSTDYFNFAASGQYVDDACLGSYVDTPRRSPRTARGAGHAEHPQMPNSAPVDIDEIEAACTPWPRRPRRRRAFPWHIWNLFGSKFEHIAHNPSARGVISSSIRARFIERNFVARVALCLVFCLVIACWYDTLGLSCQVDEKNAGQETGRAALRGTQPGNPVMLVWAETLVGTGACFLLAQGYFGTDSMRATRERMERVRQTAVTIAYSFLMTTNADHDEGLSREELQLIVYECLALLTAYPIAVLQQIRGNTCEPAVTRYCHEVAIALQRLRNGAALTPGTTWHDDDDSHVCKTDERRSRRSQCVPVDYFFEIFSLQLQLEYDRQAMQTKVPAVAAQHIIYSLRNHFENIVDLGNLDDRRVPIVRENIDMLALAGRECNIFSSKDAAPVAFLWTVDLACRVLALGIPIQNCDWFTPMPASASTSASSPEEPPSAPSLFQLTLVNYAAIVFVSLVCASLLTVLAEMWQMWRPFEEGVNVDAWTLGVAGEIDNLLNEFYEYDPSVVVRRHAYLQAPERRCCESDLGEEPGRLESDARPLTV